MPNSLRSRIKSLWHQGHLSREDCDRIRDALDKQIPKKIECVSTSDDEFIGYVCKCNYFIGIPRNYCPNCGQAIDWSDEDD